MLFYIVIGFLVTFYIGFLIYAKIQSPFWFHQPVHHVYEWIPRLRMHPYYKLHHPSKRNLYCDFKHIYIFPYEEIKDTLKTKMIELMQGHYIDNSVALYHQNANYIDKTLYPGSYVSMYFDEKYFLHGNTFWKGFEESCVYGVITSRPQNILFSYAPGCNASVHVLDHICIHDDFKRKNIFRNLIQTHIYRHSHEEFQHKGSYVWREEINLCENVVPITQYKTYTFVLESTKITKLPFQYRIVHITDHHKETWKAIYCKMASSFQICVLPDILNALQWLSNERYKIYASYVKKINEENIYGVYLFEDTLTSWETQENGRVYRLAASFLFGEDQRSDLLFFRGFLHSLRLLQEEKKFGVLEIPNISMNSIILARWQEKYSCHNETETALYSYNLIVPRTPILSHSVIYL